jgi:UDP-N-acetylmuramate--alanine ligase
MDALRPLNRALVSFGLSEKADVHAANIESLGARTDFDLIYKGEALTRVSLRVPGLHNVKNALAAAAATLCLGVDATAIQYGLAGFTGAGRRFEFKGKYRGADVYDDYAHHPGELKALIDAVLPLGYQRIAFVFQPHTYTRTKALYFDFIEQLSRVERLYLAPIYAAREQNTVGISSADLAGEIPGAQYFESFEAIERDLKENARPGDLIVTVGAGDVYKIGEDLVAESAAERQ